MSRLSGRHRCWGWGEVELERERLGLSGLHLAFTVVDENVVVEKGHSSSVGCRTPGMVRSTAAMFKDLGFGSPGQVDRDLQGCEELLVVVYVQSRNERQDDSTSDQILRSEMAAPRIIQGDLDGNGTNRHDEERKGALLGDVAGASGL